MHGEALAGQIAVDRTIRNRVNDGMEKSWWGRGTQAFAKTKLVQLLKQGLIALAACYAYMREVAVEQAERKPRQAPRLVGAASSVR